MALAQQEQNKMDLRNKKGLVIFVRHGQTDWNTVGRMQGREDIPLNEKGLEQARQTADGIKAACDHTGIIFDKVISSPLMRACVTGEMIAKAIGCDNFYCDERVIERDFGALSGKLYDHNSRAITEDVVDCPSLERVSSLVDRVNDFICESADINENILVVTHGAVTRIYANNATKAPEYEITEPFLLNCHLVVYSYNGKEAILQGYNIPSHGLDKFLEEI